MHLRERSLGTFPGNVTTLRGVRRAALMALRVAAAGLGRMGRFYAQAITALAPRARLVGVADPLPAARASVELELGVTASAEPLALLERSDIDALIVATPASTHADIVVAAANAGKAIFCEKPLALSIEQTQAVLDAVERAGVLLQVGFMRRFDPPYVQAKAAIDAGQIGRALIFKGIGRDPSCPPADYGNPAMSGGLLVDMAIHDFDLARWLMSSEVERVATDGALLACEHLASVGDIDNAVVNLRFRSGALGNVEVSRNARYGYDIRTEVLGSDGAVIVGQSAEDTGPLQIRQPESAPAGAPPHFVRRFATAYRAQIEHFIDCVEQQKLPLVGGRDALAAFKIARAATLSWQSARPIALAELEMFTAA